MSSKIFILYVLLVLRPKKTYGCNASKKMGSYETLLMCFCRRHINHGAEFAIRVPITIGKFFLVKMRPDKKNIMEEKTDYPDLCPWPRTFLMHLEQRQYRRHILEKRQDLAPTNNRNNYLQLAHAFFLNATLPDGDKIQNPHSRQTALD